jgi:competence ComEA-like helix-hairpin-helix protein
MKSIRKFLRNHFGFKTLEINGFIGLILVMLIFLFVNSTNKENLFFDNPSNEYTLEDRRIVEEMMPILEQKAQVQEKLQNKNWNNKNEVKSKQLFAFNPNKTDLETWQKLGVKKYLAERIINYVSKGGKFRTKENLLKIYGFPEELYQELEAFIVLPQKEKKYKSKEKRITQEIELVEFNPNKTDLETWQKLGVKKYLAERIIKYTNKGGKFKSKEDLLKIYGFPEKIYQQLEDFIVLEEGKNTSTNNTQLTDSQQDKNEIKSYRQIEIQKFDINQADTSTLKQINGIGSYFAKKIIELRDKLGGFSKIEQAKEVWNLKPETFDKLAQYAFVDESFEIKKININTASQDELKNHPYISYKLANTIVNYREQHGKYQKVDELSKIHSINSQLLEKIRPYLKIE